MILESLISIIIAVAIVVLIIRNNYYNSKRKANYKMIIDYLEENLINNCVDGNPKYQGLCAILYSMDSKLYHTKERRSIERVIMKHVPKNYNF